MSRAERLAGGLGGVHSVCELPVWCKKNCAGLLFVISLACQVKLLNKRQPDLRRRRVC
jgi:hypothetical protein